MAILDKIAGGGEAVRDKTAGEIVAILDKIAGGGEAVRDKTAGEIEAILEASERVEEFIVELVRLYLKPRNESTNLLSNHLLRLY